jgi:(S)-ureidoglycine aminohydrolase
MIKGDTEMQIGEDFYQGKAGDVYFLESEIPHAIENKGEEQCMYFAFQWE